MLKELKKKLRKRDTAQVMQVNRYHTPPVYFCKVLFSQQEERQGGIFYLCFFVFVFLTGSGGF